MPNQLKLMASDANYPSNNGVRLGLNSEGNTSLYPIQQMYVNMLIGGTPGSSPSYQLEVQTVNGDWVKQKDFLLTSAGQVSGWVEGCAVRIAAANGSSPGTGANTPRYFLGVIPTQKASVRHSA